MANSVGDWVSPPVSVFARTPTDMRLMREILKALPKKRCTAHYVGCAYGEDFFSWYTVGWGTGCVVNWSASDVLDDPVNFCKVVVPKAVNITCQDFHNGLPKLDIIIAQHVWTPDTAINVAGMKALLKSNPTLLIARDHKLVPEILIPLLPDGYGAFNHLTVHDPSSTPTDGPVIINLNVIQAPVNSAYVKLRHLGGANWPEAK